MKNQVLRIILLVLLLVVQKNSMAGVIVNTGASTQFGGLVLATSQWVAGFISIDDGYRIENISTNYWGNGEQLTFALYEDESGLPGTEIVSFIVETEVTDTSTINTLNIPADEQEISAGNYWVSFEVREGQSFSGGLQGGSDAAFFNPLEKDAFWLALDGNWRSVSTHQGRIGLTIEATPVPLPASGLLFASMCLFMMRVRKSLSQ